MFELRSIQPQKFARSFAAKAHGLREGVFSGKEMVAYYSSGD
jgi:hypothetical protein